MTPLAPFEEVEGKKTRERNFVLVSRLRSSGGASGTGDRVAEAFHLFAMQMCWGRSVIGLKLVVCL